MKTIQIIIIASVFLIVAGIGCKQQEQSADTAALPDNSVAELVSEDSEPDPITPPPDFEDPVDGYFAAYLLVREAEKSEVQEKSIRSYREALGYFNAVKEKFPDWKTAMVDNRIELTTKNLALLTEPKADE
jgi:hypothetical protein